MSCIGFARFVSPAARSCWAEGCCEPVRPGLSQHSGSPVAYATGHRFRDLEPWSSPVLQAQKQGFTAGWSDEVG